MKILTRAQFDFYEAARLAERFKGEPEEEEYAARATTMWNGMILDEARRRNAGKEELPASVN